jgi:hypothetical protein
MLMDSTAIIHFRTLSKQEARGLIIHIKSGTVNVKPENGLKICVDKSF